MTPVPDESFIVDQAYSISWLAVKPNSSFRVIMTLFFLVVLSWFSWTFTVIVGIPVADKQASAKASLLLLYWNIPFVFTQLITVL